MHLKLATDPQFKAAVKARQPSLEGPVEVEFDARFRALSYTELEAYEATVEGNVQVLRDVLAGADVVGDDDKPLAWSDELRDRLIDTPWLRSALLTAYRLGLSGAARGN